MKINLTNYQELINNEKGFIELIERTKRDYRPLDPGLYLYNLLMNKSQEDIFSDEYLELVYTTLIAWNMNGRAAKLADINKFKGSIRKNRKEIESMVNMRLEKLTENELKKVIAILQKLFNDLELVKTNSPLVTFSKTMHFLLPNLIVPIDRRYTITFFYGLRGIPEKGKQFAVFEEIFTKFWELSKKYDLSRYVDKVWNRNIPKIMDNAIIGFKIKNKAITSA